MSVIIIENKASSFMLDHFNLICISFCERRPNNWVVLKNRSDISETPCKKQSVNSDKVLRDTRETGKQIWLSIINA